MARNYNSSGDDYGQHAVGMGEDLLAMQRQGKSLDRDAMFNVAMKHTNGDTQEALKHMQGLMKGNVDAQGLMGMAAKHMGDQAGPLGEIFKQVGGDNLGKYDTDKIASVPGMVVDKETGDVKLLGILPVPQQYARLAAAGYTAALTQINGEAGKWAFDKGFDFEKSLAKGTLPGWAQGRIGWAAALGTMGLISFWPDVNSMIKLERDGTKETAKLANQLAPVLQQMKGKGGVAALYSVSQGENEVIYNARRKLNKELYGERMRTVIQSCGRLGTFGISFFGQVAGHAKNKLSGGGAAVAGAAGAELSIEDRAMNEAEASISQVAERLKIAPDSERYQEMLTKAYDKKLEALHTAAGVKPDAPDASYKFLGMEIPKKAANMLGATALQQYADQWADSYYTRYTKDIPKVSALDMILTLRQQIDKHSGQDRFKLPDGMRIEGGKGYDAQHLPLADYIVQIFEQHERDCNGADGDIPDRLNEDLLKASTSIAKELKAGHLDALALIRLVGERKIVREGGRKIVSMEDVAKQIDDMKMTMRHVEWVDPKKYAADANFELKDVQASWKAAAEDEKQMLVALIPDQVLNAAGVPMDEVSKFKAHNVNEYNGILSGLTQALSGKGAEFLQKDGGLTHQEAEQILELGQQIKTQGAGAVESALPGHGNKQDITRPLANAVMAISAKHDGMLAALLGRQHS